MLALVSIDTSNSTLNSVASVKDTAGNSFSLVGYLNNSDGGTTALYALATPSGDVGGTTVITATSTITCFGDALVILEVQGISATPDGTLATNSGTASPATNGTYSSSTANEFLIFGAGDNGDGFTYSTPTGWTAATGNQVNSEASAVAFYKNSTGGSETASSTISGSAHWSSVIVAFPTVGQSAAVERVPLCLGPNHFQPCHRQRAGPGLRSHGGGLHCLGQPWGWQHRCQFRLRAHLGVREQHRHRSHHHRQLPRLRLVHPDGPHVGADGPLPSGRHQLERHHRRGRHLLHHRSRPYLRG